MVKKRQEVLFHKQLQDAAAAGSADAKAAALKYLVHLDAYDFCNAEFDKATTRSIATAFVDQLKKDGVLSSGDCARELQINNSANKGLNNMTIDYVDHIQDNKNEEGDAQYTKAMGLSNNVSISCLHKQLNCNRYQVSARFPGFELNSSNLPLILVVPS